MGHLKKLNICYTGPTLKIVLNNSPYYIGLVENLRYTIFPFPVPGMGNGP